MSINVRHYLVFLTLSARLHLHNYVYSKCLAKRKDGWLNTSFCLLYLTFHTASLMQCQCNRNFIHP